MQRLSRAVVCLALLAASGTVASARPVVALKLSGFVISKDASGGEHLVPVSTTAIHPGDRVRWNLVAVNTGDQPAVHLTAPDAIPANTEYAPGTARGPGKAEFSTDGGKTWSAAPTIVVQTAAGSVTKAAPASSYTNVRFTDTTALAPKASVAYSFEVIVK